MHCPANRHLRCLQFSFHYKQCSNKHAVILIQISLGTSTSQSFSRESRQTLMPLWPLLIEPNVFWIAMKHSHLPKPPCSYRRSHPSVLAKDLDKNLLMIPKSLCFPDIELVLPSPSSPAETWTWGQEMSSHNVNIRTKPHQGDGKVKKKKLDL